MRRFDMRLTDRAVLQAIEAAKFPMSYQTIAVRIGCSPSTVYKAVRRMKALGILTPIETRRNKPYAYVIDHSRIEP